MAYTSVHFTFPYPRRIFFRDGTIGLASLAGFGFSLGLCLIDNGLLSSASIPGRSSLGSISLGPNIQKFHVYTDHLRLSIFLFMTNRLQYRHFNVFYGVIHWQTILGSWRGECDNSLPKVVKSHKSLSGPHGRSLARFL